MRPHGGILCVTFLAAALYPARAALAHGVAGERNFIEPFVTEDAAVQNEAVVQGGYARRDGPDPWAVTYEIEKRIGETTSVFIEHGAAFNVGGGGGREALETESENGDHTEDDHHDESAGVASRASSSSSGGHGHGDESASAGGGGTGDGFLNLEAGIKQQIFVSERHETIISLAAAVVAPTGTERVGAEDHAAIEVLGLFAKGFGDLPDGLSALRPLALQGDVGIETPLGDGRPVNEFVWNAALSYDLRVLHQQLAFPRALEPLALVAEFNFETHLNGPARAVAESFVTAGVVYSHRRQLNDPGVTP
ncbi:MAG: hypothetical protein Q8R92_14960 [Deltaproteobacteria bacterium]|nr:hypothetical protein [Deltaproteobacteria bacterium]